MSIAALVCCLLFSDVTARTSEVPANVIIEKWEQVWSNEVLEFRREGMFTNTFSDDAESDAYAVTVNWLPLHETEGSTSPGFAEIEDAVYFYYTNGEDSDKYYAYESKPSPPADKPVSKLEDYCFSVNNGEINITG